MQVWKKAGASKLTVAEQRRADLMQEFGRREYSYTEMRLAILAALGYGKEFRLLEADEAAEVLEHMKSTNNEEGAA